MGEVGQKFRFFSDILFEWPNSNTGYMRGIDMTFANLLTSNKLFNPNKNILKLIRGSVVNVFKNE